MSRDCLEIAYEIPALFRVCKRQDNDPRVSLGEHKEHGKIPRFHRSVPCRGSEHTTSGVHTFAINRGAEVAQSHTTRTLPPRTRGNFDAAGDATTPAVYYEFRPRDALERH